MSDEEKRITDEEKKIFSDIREGRMITNEADRAILRNQRLRLCITQKIVTGRAGIPLQSYQQFESGK